MRDFERALQITKDDIDYAWRGTRLHSSQIKSRQTDKERERAEKKNESE
jgi:hypothetical protein